MKTAKKFLGLMVIAVAALCAIACEASKCATSVDCALVGEWESINDKSMTIKFEANGKFTTSSFEEFGLSSEIEYYAKIVDAGHVTLCDRDGNIKFTARYFFFFFEDINKLNFNGIAYEKKI